MSIVLLPGMGASAQMYPEQWQVLSDLRLLDWPSYQGEQTLPELAKRVIDEAKLSADDIIGGSSMGGMVALEIAHLLGAKQVVLLGSALSRHELNPFLKLIAPLAAITPFKLTQIFAGVSSGELGTMYAQCDTAFIRQMCLAINQWQGINSDAMNIIRMHGAKDAVINCPKNAQIINDAGHLIAMTHATACIKILQDALH